ncbi:hypothetical protein POM88_043346 [Heracleum sosnowskyi]|uniref:S1 motif domain-containing protein n=1 Tax=Heracleum sosnowskyi TaxID=360622 RepID=A0AAD8H3D7_9APIA|nr:hypothetical protein POM88_043346 [Heracleum sosnowskyi]
MRGRQGDIYSAYKCIASRDHLSVIDREDDLDMMVSFRHDYKDASLKKNDDAIVATKNWSAYMVTNAASVAHQKNGTSTSCSMEESEKKRERLKTMRMEAAQMRGISSLVLETAATNQDSCPRRFGYYTDPMAAFSGNKRSKVNQNSAQEHLRPPGNIIEIKKNLQVFGPVRRTSVHSGRHGFIVAITGVENVGNGMIRDGTGFVTFPVKYQCVVFRSFKGEILEVVVTMVDKMGFFAEAGPVQIFVSNHHNNISCEMKCLNLTGELPDEFASLTNLLRM